MGVGLMTGEAGSGGDPLHLSPPSYLDTAPVRASDFNPRALCDVRPRRGFGQAGCRPGAFKSVSLREDEWFTGAVRDYFADPMTGCTHAVSNSLATLPFTLGFEEMILARTYNSSPLSV